MSTSQDRIVFGHNFEGLYQRALGSRVTPELRAALRTLGVELEKPLLPGYPVEAWMRSLKASAGLLYPAVPPDAAYELLGREFMRGYFETMMGRALLAMLKVLGPERTFKRMTQNFRSGNNFNEIESRIVGPGHAEMTINHVLCEGPGFVQGLLAGALTLIAGKPVRVTVSRFDGTGATYVSRWDV